MLGAVCLPVCTLCQFVLSFCVLFACLPSGLFVPSFHVLPDGLPTALLCPYFVHCVLVSLPSGYLFRFFSILLALYMYCWRIMAPAAPLASQGAICSASEAAGLPASWRAVASVYFTIAVLSYTGCDTEGDALGSPPPGIIGNYVIVQFVITVDQETFTVIKSL